MREKIDSRGNIQQTCGPDTAPVKVTYSFQLLLVEFY